MSHHFFVRVSIFVLASAVVVGAWGQAVQLPSFQHTNVNTSVWVPDGGTTNLGGVTRASSGYNSSGTPILPFQNRSYGSDVGASNVSVSANIIDLQEMDEAILGGAGSGPGYTTRRGDRHLTPLDRFSERMNANVDSRTGSGVFRVPEEGLGMAVPKVKSRAPRADVNSDLSFEEDFRTGKSAEQRRKEALVLAKRGYREEKAGNAEDAAEFYRRAAALASGELRVKIVKRLVNLKDIED